MQIITKRSSKGFMADFKDLPGSPQIGDGRTKAEAIACLFFRCIQDKTINQLDYKTLSIDGKLWKTGLPWPEKAKAVKEVDEFMFKQRPHDFRVGDIVEAHYIYDRKEDRWRTTTGQIVHIIRAGHKPGKEVVEKYYELKPGDRLYNAMQVCRAKLDRLVIKKDTGHYFIGPLGTWAISFKRICPKEALETR